MKRNRNHAALCLILTLCLAFLVSCGADEETGSPQMSPYTVIRKEVENIPEPQGRNTSWHLLGRQFYQEEAVQIWGINAGSLVDIYLYRQDGSGELLLGDAPMEYYVSWYLDREGGRYLFSKDILIHLDAEGNEIFRQKGYDVMDLCQLKDGRVMALVQKEDRNLALAEVDPTTGKMSEKDKADLGQDTARCYIGAGQDGLLLMDADGIWELAPESGSRKSVLPFMGTYDPGTGASDFLLGEDGTALVLQKSGILQTLQLFDPAEGREVIILRTLWLDKDMKKYIEMFNQQNDEYFVIAEEMDEFVYIRIDEVTIRPDFSTFQNETAMNIATGKGADIVSSDAVSNSWDLAENGVFEDLAPYMERDGIHTEDYFPVAFSGWRDNGRIYGITTYAALTDVWIDAELLEGNEEGDVGKLVKALLDYKGDAVFFDKYWMEQLPGYFFGDSESLWGMVDWENGTCDFSGELFAGILEVAKRYGYDTTKKGLPAVAGRLVSDECSFYSYDYYAAQEEAKGRVNIGYLSEKGNGAAAFGADLWAISSASAHKEGAWAFLRFLLSDEVQAAERSESGPSGYDGYPVRKSCFDICGARAIDEGSIRGHYNNLELELLNTLGIAGYMELFDPTEERVARIKAVLEADERSSSFRTDKIMSIIDEEAGAYFAGDKSIEEVAAVIQNRVQLYIDEHR